MNPFRPTPRETFQNLLRELFQIEAAAELDFGIYRIMGQKRGIVEKFIEQDLLATIDGELRTGALKKESSTSDQLAELAAQIRETLADDAIDAEGNLGETYAKTKLGKEYLAMQKAGQGSRSMAELESTIYNHLYDFFKRYYDKGDFMSQRRYSKREKYAIPYNGEETHFHWSNADQYYIKTGETFTDYRWKDPSGAVRVKFSVTRANVPKDNIKAPDKRFFIPQLDALTVETLGTAKDRDRHTLLTLPFHYRGLTDAETKRYEALADELGIKNGNGNGGKLQAALLAEAVEALPKSAKVKADRELVAALGAEHHKDAEGEAVSRLAHHLRRFTVKNTSDYFIHKDLEAFLTRELDFYLKNEVLHLDNLEAGGEQRAEGWFEMMATIRRIGRQIILFLAEIENFQKRLFEKKKFVTECHYCLTLDRIPEELYPEIAKNEKQIEEWKRLFAIDQAKGWSEPPSVGFLKKHWNLVVDTKFFDAAFSECVLSEIDNISDQAMGLVLHAENFQGLKLLEESYQSAVPCAYIDPPYNTEGDGFLYKDQYRSSSWLSMMRQGITLARNLLADAGSLTVSLDDGEQDKAKMLMKQVFGELNFISSIIWQKKYAPANDAKWFSEDHDFLLIAAKSREEWYPKGLPRSEKQDRAYKNLDGDNRGRWRTDNYTSNKSRSERPNCWYAIIQPNTGEEIWPSEDAVWRYSKEMHERNIREDRIWWGQSGTNRVPAYKRFLSDVGEIRPRTIWQHTEVGHNQDGMRENQNLFGLKSFSSPKPVALIERVIQLNQEDLVLDYFAGSGTTGHAVLNLNRSEDKLRRYLLIEMGAHFDTVLVPRLKKVVYSADWKSGKPTTRDTGISHCFKYVRLESYEDALGNIAFDENEVAQRQLAFDQYVIHYMLDFETRGSETLLNTEKLVAPFDYKLEIREGDDLRVKPVDLPETFNFLIGLRVRTRRVYWREVKRGRKTEKVKYLVLRGRTNPHATGGEREVVVIWRTTEGWQQADYIADRAFIEDELELTKEADEVFTNDDSLLRHPQARSLDPVFKRRMFNQPD